MKEEEIVESEATGLRGAEWGAPALLVAFALLMLAVAVWNFVREVSNLDVTLPPVAALLMAVIPISVVLYAAYRLRESDFDAPRRWQVALAGIAGGAIFGAETVGTILIRLAEGRAVGEPPFVIGVAVDTGAVAGILAGWLYVRARRDAETAQRERDRFSFLNSILRHDILNSMMIVQSRAEFLVEESEGRNRDFAETIRRRSEDVVDLIERTRTVIRTLTGDLDADFEPIDVREVIEDRALATRESHEDATVETDVPEGLRVQGDELLEDVIGNLLSNGIEHNDKDEPHIEATAGREDDRVVIRVADNGPGIPEEYRDSVFRRGETGIHTDEAGSGFGLFFVDTMVERYGGSITIEDNDPEGSVFVLDLPAA